VPRSHRYTNRGSCSASREMILTQVAVEGCRVARQGSQVGSEGFVPGPFRGSSPATIASIPHRCRLDHPSPKPRSLPVKLHGLASRARSRSSSRAAPPIETSRWQAVEGSFPGTKATAFGLEPSSPALEGPMPGDEASTAAGEGSMPGSTRRSVAARVPSIPQQGSLPARGPKARSRGMQPSCPGARRAGCGGARSRAGASC